MINRLEYQLKQVGINLDYIGVLIDSVDENFGGKNYSYLNKITSVFKYPFKKFERHEISSQLITGELRVIRINPFTNTPIIQSLETSNYGQSVLLSNEEFIQLIPTAYLNVGYFDFNNLLHPYFFNMDKVLSDIGVSESLLKAIFGKLIRYENLENFDIICYPKNSGIGKLDFDNIRNKVLKNQQVQVVEFDRFPINEGWRFSHAPKSLEQLASNKNVLILDDGSCTGESLIQMIDEIAVFSVAKIVVLSLIGRVNDHKREFFSRIESLKTNFTTIPIKIYFGSQWHIPTYFLNKSPITNERDWLRELITSASIPQNIKKIAEGVLEEVRPKGIDEGNNLRLLKSKDGSPIFKELIVVRNEIGKITEFRFYKEYFDFFNLFISSYESKSKKTRGEFPYYQIELICGVLLHEPYLFDKIKMVVPDVVDKIKEFVKKLLFEDIKVDHQNLKYSWDSKTMIHLIFIVYKNEELIELLNVKNINNLINTYVQNKSDLNYFLFKLCYYLPVSKMNSEISQSSGKILLQLSKTIEKNELSDSNIRILKRFRSYSNTLASNDDYSSNLAKVKINYEKITDEKFHNESMSAEFDIFIVQCITLAQEYNKDSEFIVINTWEKISPFIEILINFSNNYPNFFLPFGINSIQMLETNSNSLKYRYGKLSDLVYSINSSSDFLLVKRIAESIYDDFVNSKSYYYKIFKNIITNDLDSILLKFKADIQKSHSGFKVSINNQFTKLGSIDVPERLLVDVVFGQLIKNFRHADKNFPITICIDGLNHDYLSITIKNNSLLSNTQEVGGGAGIDQLMNLNGFPDGKISYKWKEESGYFQQEIKLQKI